MNRRRQLSHNSVWAFQFRSTDLATITPLLSSAHKRQKPKGQSEGIRQWSLNLCINTRKLFKRFLSLHSKNVKCGILSWLTIFSSTWISPILTVRASRSETWAWALKLRRRVRLLEMRAGRVPYLGQMCRRLYKLHITSRIWSPAHSRPSLEAAPSS